jgi:hypothetical protein
LYRYYYVYCQEILKVAKCSKKNKCKIFEINRITTNSWIERTCKFKKKAQRKNNCINQILCRNCLLKHVTEERIEAEIEVSGRQGRRRRQLLDEFEEMRCYRNLKRKY